MKNKRFKLGNKVKYTSGKWGDEIKNPLWGGIYGKIGGTISYVSENFESVDATWDNGEINTYDNEDLELIEEQKQMNLF